MLDYVSERRKDIERKERERYRNQREKEIEERGDNRISYAEYIEIKHRKKFNIPSYTSVNYETECEIKNEDFPLLEETERRGFIRIRNKNTRLCKEQTN